MSNISSIGKTDEELYAQLKDMPNFEKFPLPEHWYKKFNIVKPKAMSFQEFALSRAWLEHKFDSDMTYEIRKEPAPGGVRPIIEVEPPQMEIITRTSDESSPQLQIEMAPPKESTGTEPQQS